MYVFVSVNRNFKEIWEIEFELGASKYKKSCDYSKFCK